MKWHFNNNGIQTGPLEDSEARSYAQSNPNSYVWREGFAEWILVKKVPELSATAGIDGPPPMGRYGQADIVDYKVIGAEMQFVEIELDPGESVIAEAGSMMYKDTAIYMDAIFGDGSNKTKKNDIFGHLVGAGKRLLTGESLFMTVFTNKGQNKARIAFAAPYPGNVIPIKLTDYSGTLICQKDSFLCAAKGVSVGIYFQRRILTGLFGGEGFIMQKLEGDGMTFIHAGGTVVKRELQAGETLHVDTGCVVAFEASIDFNIEQAGNIKTALFGGEGLFFAVLRGPGKVWLQSLPFSRLAGRMLQAAPQHGGSKGEGSVLKGLGGLLDGDNFF